MATCHSLRCERIIEPLGIGETEPLLEWLIESDRRGHIQTAYRIQVTFDSEDSGWNTALLWDSGIIESSKTFDIPYQGDPLASSQRYFWRVASRDERGEWTAWSKPSWWETALLRDADWKAEWIEPNETLPDVERPAPYFRTEFDIEKPIRSARLYATSHGLYELSLNGSIVGDAVFNPGYTSYAKRLQYQTYDVTDLINTGPHAIGVIVGDGWYRGKLGIASRRDTYGTTPGFLLQLRILHRDGTETIIATGNGWKHAYGAVRHSDLKDGETYDARLEFSDWNRPSFDDSAWSPARIAHYERNNLVASIVPPVRRKERLLPACIKKNTDGSFILDFGQNIAGRLRFRVSGPAGTALRIRHGEFLDKNGMLSLAHLQPTAPGIPRLHQEDRYILKGEGVEEYEPKFTYHGFRYAEVFGWPDAKIDASGIEAIVLRTDLERTGYFRCSDSDLNRLHRNILWSMYGNSLDIPTDCPTRERAGWAADAHVFASTAVCLADMRTFYEKWLSDLRADQHPDGLVPNTIPDIGHGRADALSELTNGSSGWGDATVIIPWILHSMAGDRRILTRQYASMKAWIDFGVERLSKTGWSRRISPLKHISAARVHREPYILDSGFHWGEWLQPGERAYVPATMGKHLFLDDRSEIMTATANLAHSVDLLARIAAILGQTEDSYRYKSLFERMCDAYTGEFIRDGRLEPGGQSASVRTLAFGLAPTEVRPTLSASLAQLVETNGCHPDTGFLSTVHLLDVLRDAGYADLAYRLLQQDGYPSWLYQVRNGATTLWENWDGIDQKGSAHGSLNHTALGSIGHWLYETVAGIAIDAADSTPPRVRIAPIPGGGLTYAVASRRAPFGTIRVRWERSCARMSLFVSVPANTQAHIRLPHAVASDVTESGHRISENGNRYPHRQDGKSTLLFVGSGAYSFNWPLRDA